MDDWVPAEDFIAADVIRWTEGIFDRKRKGKALRIGERVLTAEVLERTTDGWVRLLVLTAVVSKADFAGRTIPLIHPRDLLRRGEKTILRGKPVRLRWTDESARRTILGLPEPSRFIPE